MWYWNLSKSRVYLFLTSILFSFFSFIKFEIFPVFSWLLKFGRKIRPFYITRLYVLSFFKLCNENEYYNYLFIVKYFAFFWKEYLHIVEETLICKKKLPMWFLECAVLHCANEYIHITATSVIIYYWARFSFWPFKSISGYYFIHLLHQICRQRTNENVMKN